MQSGPNTPVRWSDTLDRIRGDRRRLGAWTRAQFGCRPFLLVVQPACVATVLHRVSHYLWRRRWRKASRLMAQLNTVLTGADIHPHSNIGEGFLLAHPTGCALLTWAGRGLTVMARSGAGMLPVERDVGAGPGVSQLGADCAIGPACGIEGPRRVGDRVHVVTAIPLMRDVPGDHDVLPRRRASAASSEQTGHHPWPPAPPCEHRSLRALWRDLTRDLDAFQRESRTGGEVGGTRQRLSAMLTTQFSVLALHRLSHFLHVNGWRRLAGMVVRANALINRTYIAARSCVGGGWFLPHPCGVVFNARAGRDLVMFAYTVVAPHGEPMRTGLEVAPVLGDSVTLAAHSSVHGPIRVGDGARTGFGVHVEDPVPDHALAASLGFKPRLEPSEPAAPADDKAAAQRAGDTDARAELRADWARLKAHLGAVTVMDRALAGCSRSWIAVRLFRASHVAHRRGRPALAYALWVLNQWLTGADLRPWSRVGPGLLIPFPPSVSLNGHAGRDLSIMALAGIDPRPRDAGRAAPPAGLPRVGNGVYVDHHANVTGPVSVGDDVYIAPCVHIFFDVPGPIRFAPHPTRSIPIERLTGALSV